MNENEVPERLGPLPGPKTPENDRKSKILPDFPDLLVEKPETKGRPPCHGHGNDTDMTMVMAAAMAWPWP